MSECFDDVRGYDEHLIAVLPFCPRSGVEADECEPVPVTRVAQRENPW